MILDGWVLRQPAIINHLEIWRKCNFERLVELRSRSMTDGSQFDWRIRRSCEVAVPGEMPVANVVIVFQ
jgi:hypothetical protein